MICEFYVLFLGEREVVSHRNPLFELQGGATLLDEVQQVSVWLLCYLTEIANHLVLDDIRKLYNHKF